MASVYQYIEGHFTEDELMEHLELFQCPGCEEYVDQVTETFDEVVVDACGNTKLYCMRCLEDMAKCNDCGGYTLPEVARRGVCPECFETRTVYSGWKE